MIVLALTLVGQVSPPSSDKTEEKTDSLCTVAGRVVTAAEGTALRSGRIALLPEDWKSNSHVYATTSDSDGRFLLKDVPPGRYKFVAMHVGFVEQQYRAHGTEAGAILGLRPGQKIEDVLFRLTRAAVITGSVNNENGEPLVGVQVLVLNRPSEDEIEDLGEWASRKLELQPVASGHTDDRGQFRIFGLKPGQYYIRATDLFEPDAVGLGASSEYLVQQNLGSEYGPVYYPSGLQIAQAESISVRAGDEVQADISMRHIKPVEVGGHVIGLKGPAKGAWVYLDAADEYGSNSNYQATTDEKGAFNFKGIPPGTYMLVVFQREDDSYISHASARQKVEVAEENIQSLVVSLDKGTSLEGRVIAAGPGTLTLNEIRVGFFSTDDDQASTVSRAVKSDGAFELYPVPEVSYRIAVWGLESGWYIKSARFGAHDILENGLQVEQGASSGRLEIVVSSACAQLEGSVIEDDQPLTGARVGIRPDPETAYNRFRLAHTRTDQAGHFSFSCVVPGKYRVIAKSPALADTDSIQSEPQSITISERDHKTIEAKIVKPDAESAADHHSPDER
jgi:protocatechuate 3,4-dioxygenase beta subunit